MSCRLKTRNAAGDMIPLGSFVTVKHSSGPDRVMHYNSYPTAEINGGPAAGFSSGQAQAAIEQLARQELPNGMSFEWTELTYQQIIAGNTAVLIFPLVVLLVFSGARRSVRELESAARGHPDHADGAALGHHRRRAHARRQQHLHANRP